MSSSAPIALRSDLLNREQAAAYLGVSPRTLAVWKSTGRYDLPVVKLGRRIVRYRKSDLDAFIADTHIMFCSDGGLHGSHPRGSGTFPRILGVYVRERHVLTLEQAVHKMTDLAARRMGLKDRGLIAPGMKADIVIFDAATVKDTATTAKPQSPPIGVPYVLVNGTPVIDNGALTGLHPGAVLRRMASINHALRP